MGVGDLEGDISKVGSFEICDKWILASLDRVSRKVFEAVDKHEYAYAGSMIYEFAWNEYCDWYIELAKIRLYGEDQAKKSDVEKLLVYVLKRILQLLEPFMPFICQEIYSFIGDDSLMLQTWKEVADIGATDSDIEVMEAIMDAVKSIRNARQEMNIAPSKKAKVYVVSGNSEIYTSNRQYFIQLASSLEITAISEKDLPDEDMIVAISKDSKFYIPVEDLIDYAKERERLSKELVKLEDEIGRIEKKLSNEGFTSKAPKEVIDGEKEKLETYRNMEKETRATLNKVIAIIEKKK